MALIPANGTQPKQFETDPILTYESIEAYCFWPIGFFPRLICLLVEYFSSLSGGDVIIDCRHDCAKLGCRNRELVLSLHPVYESGHRFPDNVLVITTDIPNAHALVYKYLMRAVSHLQSTSLKKLHPLLLVHFDRLTPEHYFIKLQVIEKGQGVLLGGAVGQSWEVFPWKG